MVSSNIVEDQQQIQLLFLGPNDGAVWHHFLLHYGCFFGSVTPQWPKLPKKSFILLSGSCHLDRALNVEIGFEYQISVIVIFFTCGRVLQFGAHSRYYKGALTQKRSFLVVCTSFRSDFHVGWKKSKQTFSTKFIIQLSVQMTWTRN